jgi:hypothetical protein
MKIDIPLSLLRRLYIDEQKSITDIAKMYGYSLSTIRSRLLEHGLLRSINESLKIARLQGKFPSKRGIAIGPMSSATKKKLSLSQFANGERKAKGISLKPAGYFEITRGNNKGKLLHRVIMEQHLGRTLRHDEIVHHKDRNRENNDISNLQVMTKKQHSRHHGLENLTFRKRKKNGQFM